MGRTVVLHINYDADPPFTQRVRELTETALSSCFESLDEDEVIIQWSRGSVSSNVLGKSDSINAAFWSINLLSSLTSPDANALTGGYTVNVNPTSLRGDAARAAGDVEVALANTIANQIGVHCLAGESGHILSNGGPTDIDRPRITPALCRALGTWSPAMCAEIRAQLEVK